MKFEEAFKHLKKHKRIWHPSWQKTGFIFRELFYGHVYVLALWDNLVEFPSEPRFKGVDDRLYSTIGHFVIEKNATSEYVINIVRQITAEYFGKAQFSLAMMGFKIEKNNLEDEWEIVK